MSIFCFLVFHITTVYKLSFMKVFPTFMKFIIHFLNKPLLYLFTKNNLKLRTLVVEFSFNHVSGIPLCICKVAKKLTLNYPCSISDTKLNYRHWTFLKHFIVRPYVTEMLSVLAWGRFVICNNNVLVLKNHVHPPNRTCLRHRPFPPSDMFLVTSVLAIILILTQNLNVLAQ